MADQDIQAYLADKKKSLGASSVSKGGVTLQDTSFPSPGSGADMHLNESKGRGK